MKTLQMIYEETDEEGHSILRAFQTIPGEDLESRDQHVAALLMAAYRHLRNCVNSHKSIQSLDKMAKVLREESGQ